MDPFFVLLSGLFFACSGFGSETTNAPSAKLSMKEMLTDPEDGKVDASEWLSTAKGFFPVVTIITEPAVGYGAGLMLMFFYDSI